MKRYPSRIQSRCQLRSGVVLGLRVIRPEDEGRMVAFHKSLSQLTVRRRYFDSFSLEARIEPGRLKRICNPDLETEVAIVAECESGDGQERKIVGVARLEDMLGRDEAEYAIIVADSWQQKGLGRKMMTQLVVLARSKGLKRISAEILPDNKGMRKMLRGLGFTLQDDYANQTTYTSLCL